MIIISTGIGSNIHIYNDLKYFGALSQGSPTHPNTNHNQPPTHSQQNTCSIEDPLRHPSTVHLSSTGFSHVYPSEMWAVQNTTIASLSSIHPSMQSSPVLITPTHTVPKFIQVSLSQMHNKTLRTSLCPFLLHLLLFLVQRNRFDTINNFIF